ncbi:unnamed protein product [Boreogadus saida]
MKMWTSPSKTTSCVLWLLTFIMISLSAFQAEAQGQRAIACCPSVSRAIIRSHVSECYVQEAQSSEDYCGIQAYILVTTSGDKFCVDPRARWLKQKLKMLTKRGVSCQPLLRPE